MQRKSQINRNRNPESEWPQPALNKLAHTCAAQVEALIRYRSIGQQKVVVEHVTVNADGQAIVGHVARGREPRENEPQPHTPGHG